MIANITQLKQYLWITSTDCDMVLKLFLDSANKIVETYIGRTVEKTDYDDIIDGNGQLFWVVPQYPVVSLEKIESNIGTTETPEWIEIPKTSYSLNAKIGKINFMWPMCRWFQNYKITYTAWYDQIPSDLVMASLKLASKYYQTRNSDWISSESNAWDSISFDESQIPNDVLIILSSYRNM